MHCTDTADLYLQFADFFDTFCPEKTRKNILLYRYQSTLKSENVDHVHLGKMGVQLLQSLIQKEVSKAIKVIKM